MAHLCAWGVYPALILVVIVFITVRPISDPDCWFHMAHGRHFLEHGEVLKRDIFSHTAAGREWISSGWLASVIMANVANSLSRQLGEGGWIGLIVGIVVFVLLHGLNIVIGVFSPSIHSLRLHLVESFGKFFEPAKYRYEPFRKTGGEE